jgi:predicted Zn-dependent protease
MTHGDESTVSLGSRRRLAATTRAALKMADAARAKSPELDIVWIALANIRLRMNAKTEALKDVAKAIELNPATKRQLPLNPNFKALVGDAEFEKLTRQ